MTPFNNQSIIFYVLIFFNIKTTKKDTVLERILKYSAYINLNKNAIQSSM